MNCVLLAHAEGEGHAGEAFACDLCGRLRKAVLIALAILLFDPFGLEAATERAWRDMVDRATAATVSPSAASAIAVVLVDDATLGKIGGWPPPLALWQRLMERSFDAGAAAVFLDVVLGTARGGEDEVATLADVIRGEGTDAYRLHAPVVLGDLGARATLRPAGPAGRSAVLPELAGAAAGLAWLDWPLQPDERAYPLSVRWTPPVDARGGAQERPLPAAMLAAMACTRLEPALRPAWCDAGTGWLAQPARPVIPGWALSVPTSMERDLLASKPSCELYVADSCMMRFYWASGMVAADALRGIRGLLRAHAPGWVPQTWIDAEENAEDDREPSRAGLPCMPFVVVPSSMLLGEGADAVAAEHLLRGRLVLVGDASSGTPDRVPSPLHADVPGVFLHATALETLLRHGPAHPKASAELDLWLFHVARDEVMDWILKATFVGMAVVLAFRKRRVAHALAGTGDGRPSYLSLARFMLGATPHGVRGKAELLESRLWWVAMALLLVMGACLLALGWLVGGLFANPLIAGLLGMLVAWPVLSAEGTAEHDLIGGIAEESTRLFKAK